MCHFYPQSRQQKTQHSTCCACSNMNGQLKTSSTLRTSQTQQLITSRYPSYHYQHPRHSRCHRHSARSNNSTLWLQGTTSHGGTRQFCKTTFSVHISQQLQKTLLQTSTDPSHTYHKQSHLLRHSATAHSHNTLETSPNFPFIRHCRNTNISTTTIYRSIIKRSFPVLRIVLHKESHVWKPTNTSTVRFSYSSTF